MALSQESTIRVEGKIITLGDLRELVNQTESWGSQHLIDIDSTADGTKKLEVKFGDILR